MAKLLISNFSKGEFGPQLYARTDVPQYAAGAKQLKNFVIQRYGGVRFRPGFRFAGEVDEPSQSYRLLPFLFSANQAYVQLLGPNQLRVLAQGGFVVEEDIKIMGVTKETLAVMEVPFHGMSIGDRFFVDGVRGMDELNGRFARVVEVPDANHIRVDIDTSTFGTFLDSAGTLRTAPPAAPPAAPDPLPEPEQPPTTPPSTGSGGDDPPVDRWWAGRGQLNSYEQIP